MSVAIEADGLTRTFGGGRTLFGGRHPAVHAVQSADLTVQEGETLGIVGESGCGKSTLARMLVGLDRPTAGTIRIAGRDANELAGRDTRALARHIQYVFQDPVASLNPRKTIRQTLEAPMRRLLGLDARARQARLAELMEAVSLREEFLDRYPHEFSGGQAQRIGIARALAADARVIVLDEPVSALDVSVQAQVLNLLDGLKRDFNLTYIFISHDLSVIESVCDRVAVMYFGRIVEVGSARDLYAHPRHHYTALLMRSAPTPGVRRIEAEEKPAELPDPLNPPPGCAFASRCPMADDTCRRERPPLEAVDAPSDEFQMAACWHPIRTGRPVPA
ncbi:oligopeptide/dipeptide ABC transporter ATP-binding protein [Microbaculum marinum]|uniref:Oligopeptide/dipeptide ABC transporter ATP-binding protein n=1 Tax=Microbaculum marinum TaxID=1764581 RepID=A0AAW9RZ92_9HYPH